jgi:hypothetical protein
LTAEQPTFLITPPTLTPRRSGPMPLALRWSHRPGARQLGPMPTRQGRPSGAPQRAALTSTRRYEARSPPLATAGPPQAFARLLHWACYGFTRTEFARADVRGSRLIRERSTGGER